MTTTTKRVATVPFLPLAATTSTAPRPVPGRRRGLRVARAALQALAAMVGVLGLVLIAASVADAGTYQWTICSGDSEVGSAADHDRVAISTAPNTVARACYSNNNNQSSDRNAEGYATKVTVSAPPSATITTVRAHMTGNNYSYNNAWSYRLGAPGVTWSCSYYENTFPGSSCGQGAGGFNTNFTQTLNISAAGESFVEYGIYCRYSTGCGTGTLDHTVHQLIVDVRDDTRPTVTPSGPAWSSQTLSGTQQLTYDANDNAAGTSGVTVQIDSTVVADTTPSDSGGCDAARWHHCPDDSGTVAIPLAGIADGQHTMSVTSFDSVGNDSIAKTRSVLVDNQPPDVAGVSLSGTPQDGQALTCSATVSGQSPTTAYQWSRARADGSGEQPIAGATKASYTVTSADVGDKLLCAVTGTDGGGSTTRKTTPTTPPFDNGALVSAKPGATGATGAASGASAPKPTTGSSSGDGTKSTDPLIAPAGAAVNGRGATQQVTLTASFIKSRRTTSTVRYGSAPTIRGRLVNASGQPIADASLDVSATPRMAGARALAKTGVRTNAAGQFTLKLGRGVSSRTLVIAYRPNLGEATQGGRTALTLRVRAGLRLSVSRGARSLIFRGRLLGGPFPKPGQVVELQFKAGSRFQTFGHSVRAGRTGAFRMTYPAGRVLRGRVYTFRALTRVNPAYPYLAGASRRVRFLVR